MPLNAAGWSTDEDEKLIELVKPYPHLYHLFDPSRKNILARVTTWQEIANSLQKPVEECKKRWRGLRDSFMRSRRMGALHKRKIPVFEKLQFLDETNNLEDQPLDDTYFNGTDGLKDTMVDGEPAQEKKARLEQEVITDKQEYYEITLVDEVQQEDLKPFLKLAPKTESNIQAPKKIVKRNGRKKALPIPQNLQPIKILPKPIIMREPRLVRCLETPTTNQQTPEQRSQTIDKLIEKVLKENTNEIDVFFRSMAASVKKLQPNLIPKVKMEVCNVIAKYEMQMHTDRS